MLVQAGRRSSGVAGVQLRVSSLRAAAPPRPHATGADALMHATRRRWTSTRAPASARVACASARPSSVTPRPLQGYQRLDASLRLPSWANQRPGAAVGQKFTQNTRSISITNARPPHRPRLPARAHRLPPCDARPPLVNRRLQCRRAGSPSAAPVPSPVARLARPAVPGDEY
jgi:hypothetical protein